MKSPVKSGLRIDSPRACLQPMSHLTHALAAIVTRKKLTTAALAQMGKTSQPTASRILNGAAVSGDVLAAMLSAMPDARAELAPDRVPPPANPARSPTRPSAPAWWPSRRATTKTVALCASKHRALPRKV